MPYINLPDIRMFFKVLYNGNEVDKINNNLVTMLILHGGPGIVDHQIEFNAWKKFSPPLQVIFLDQRGSGNTDDGEPELWNLTQCGQDIKSFCDVTGINKPIVAGVSWGGYVAMSYATQFPTHPRALVLVNTEAKVDLKAKKAAYRVAFEKLNISYDLPPYNQLGEEKEDVIIALGEIACDYDKNPNEENFQKFIKYCIPLFSRKPFELCQPVRINMPMREKFIGDESLTMDLRKDLEQITCPVLQLAGDRDPTHPAESAIETAKYLHNTTIKIINDAGAPVYQDQESIFLYEINDFIQSLAISPSNHSDTCQLKH